MDQDPHVKAYFEDSASAVLTKKQLRARKEASQTDLRAYSKQFQEAKQKEYQSWLDNEVFELVDMRKVKVRNFITGPWVLTMKKDKDGKVEK
jgi:hypothetical protein